MDIWRKKGGNFSQEVSRTRSNKYRRPPIGGSSSWQQPVPLWEKRFCTSVGSIPWRKLLETKKFIHLYDNVVRWDDSAGEEAFQNAKNRFYANMHGLPCDVGLPDPDMYIDEIDWNSPVDPNLMLDLECNSVVPDASNKDDGVVIFGNAFPPSYQNFSPYGWGDSDEELKKAADVTLGNNGTPWDDNKHGVVQRNEWGIVDNSNNNWWGWNKKDDKAKGDQGSGDDRNNNCYWNMYDNSNCYYGDINTGKRECGRYKASRLRGDNNQRSHARRHNGNARKSTAPRTWKSTYSCTPVSSNLTGRAADGLGYS